MEILEIQAGGGGVKFWGLILADFLPALLWGWYRAANNGQVLARTNPDSGRSNNEY